MAKKLYLTDIDLNGNHMVNCAVEILESAPQNPVQGRIYFNSSDNKFYWFTGSEWKSGETYSAANMATDAENEQYGIYDSMTGTQLKFRILKTIDSRLKMNMADGVISLSLDM